MGFRPRSALPSLHSSKSTLDPYLCLYPFIHAFQNSKELPQISDPSRAQCAPLSLFPNIPHLCVLLATQVKHILDRGDRGRDVL